MKYRVSFFFCKVIVGIKVKIKGVIEDLIPGGLVVRIRCSHRCGPGLGSLSSRRRQWHPTPVLLPGKSHGQRSLVGCSP